MDISICYNANITPNPDTVKNISHFEEKPYGITFTTQEGKRCFVMYNNMLFFILSE